MNLREQVTIGIPVYNEVRFIRRALESAVVQGATVIVADNASTDGTSEICQEYANKGLIQYVRHAENQGERKNFAFLLEAATTPYFMWLGGHDLLAPGYVRELFDIMERHPDYLFCSANRFKPIDAEGQEKPIEQTFRRKRGWGFRQNLLGYESAFLRILFPLIYCGSYIIIQGLFQRRALQDAMQETPECFSIDVVMITKILAKGKAYVSNDITPGYAQRWHRSSETELEMARRQYQMIPTPGAVKDEGFDSFMELFVTSQTDTVEQLGNSAGVRKFFRNLVERVLRVRILRGYLEAEFNAFEREKMSVCDLAKRLETLKEKIATKCPGLFEEAMAVAYLGRTIVLWGDHKITWRQYAEKKKRFLERGGKIPWKRRVIWCVRYTIWRRWVKFWLRSVLSSNS